MRHALDVSDAAMSMCGDGRAGDVLTGDDTTVTCPRCLEKLQDAHVARGRISAMERCDRCGAQAYLQVGLVSGGELLFCAHHAREHHDKILEYQANGATVIDETSRLASTVRT